MKAYAYILMAAVLATSERGLAGVLEFRARCQLSLPTVPITLDVDPRDVVACRMEDKHPRIYFTHGGLLNIGGQAYQARAGWLYGQQNCQDALKEFERLPIVLFDDPEADLVLQAVFNPDYTKVTISMGLQREACHGKSVH